MTSKLELLKAANRHYPDGHLAHYFDEKTGKLVEDGEGGDTLAQFIVVELSEAADTPEEAVRLMERAQDDIREAIIGLLELTE
jgi:hypothetical protein